MRWLLVALACAQTLSAFGDELPDFYSSDPLSQRERASQAPRLIWDAARSLDHPARKGRVALDAGGTASFELAAGGQLRLQLDEEKTPPLLWLSRDGQLWWQASWTSGTEEQEWFYMEDTPSPLLARLEAGAAFRGRLFSAVTDPVESPTPYRGAVMLPELAQAELVDDDGDRLAVQRLDADEVLQLALEGPLVLSVASRPAEAAEHPQQYSLSWSLDEDPWQQVDIQRSSLSTLYQWVGAHRLHGGMDRHYLVVPEGEHRLRLKASLPLLARLEKAGSDYFLAFNEPVPGVGERIRGLVDRPLTAADRTLAELDALRQSNHIEGAADIALGYLQAGQHGHGDSGMPPGGWPGARPPAAGQALAADIERSQRFFRNLSPDARTVNGPLSLNTAWFATTSALALEVDERYYLSNGVLDRLGRGLFAGVASAPLTYPLPPRSGPSRLRLSVARLDPVTDVDLWVQYDDAPPRRLRLTDPTPRAALSLPEDAVLSHHRTPAVSLVQPTLGGEFTAQREAGHYWPAASVTLPLSMAVNEVRVWSDEPLPVALQYRASQPYQLGEIAYRALLEQVPSGASVALLHQALQAIPDPDPGPLPPVRTPQRSLENQWYPMLRYLHAAQASYLDGFSQQPPARTVVDPVERLEVARQRAQRTDWMGVLEALGSAGYGQSLAAYRLSQQALEALGEHYLAQRQRQATAVFASHAGTKRRATQELLADYASTQRWDSQVRLLAARFLREGDRQLLDPLGEALHRAGNSLWAVQLGLLSGREGAMPDWLAEAAQEAGWLKTASGAPEQSLHRGDLAARRGEVSQAMAYWQQAGERGRARIERMREARVIASLLESTERQRRLEGVERWIAWSLSPQQSFDWVSLGTRLDSSRGFSRLFSEVSRTPFALPRGSADAPVELEVVGPAVLRVQLRRVAPDTRARESIDWLSTSLVDSAGRTTLRRAPILSRTKNPYLETLHDSSAVATGDDILLEVPAGLHRVRLRPQSHEYLMQLWQWQPKQSWPVLPPLTPLALKSLLRAPAQSAHVQRATAPDFLRVHSSGFQRLPVLPAARLYSSDLAAMDVQSFREALELLQFPGQAMGPDGWREERQAVEVQGVADDAGLPESSEAAQALAVSLLWQLEQDPDLMDAVSVRLARLADAHSRVVAIRRLADSVLQDYEWQHISNSYDSAGLRQMPLEQRMHSPFRRARQALLPALTASSMLLSGRGIEGMELLTPDPVTIEIHLAQHVLPYEAPIPAEVMIQVGDQQPRRVRLSEKVAVERIRLEAGEHALRLWLNAPARQQFVTARMERADSAEPLLEEETRTYHIAAPGQPARFRVRGPAWVRVDGWLPHAATTEYRYVDEGWQTLTFETADGEDRYYRLYALRQAPDTAPLEPGTVKAGLAAPVIGPSPPPPPPEPVAWNPQDRHAPGAGLRSRGAYLDFSERSDGSEDDLLPVQGASRMEAGVSYRFRQQDRRLFSRSDLLLRRLNGRQDILGIRQWMDFYPEDSNWQLGLFGEAYLQAGKVRGLAGDNHHAARIRGSLERTWSLSPWLRHEAGITLSQRWLSLDTVPPAVLPELDPDVFSPYKRTHRRRLVLADRLTWTPHHDQRVYLEGAVISNQSLNPADIDHLEVTAAARQLFGAVAAEAGLRWRRYFNDDDRIASLDRRRFFLSGNLLRFGDGANALTLRAEAHYDMDVSDFGWRLRIGFEANAGRLSPARRPDELDFMALRRAQQRERVETNHLDPVYP